MADTTARTTPRRVQPPLVGRTREQALLRERLAAALAGEGGLVLLGGAAGIGKTALAEALAREATDQGTAVLIGRCYDLTETPPYGPWIEAFEQLPAEHGRSRLPSPLGRGEAAVSQAALFTQVRDFLAALSAERPLVLLLDDLHWADPASLDLLRYLARQAATLPLLFLATYRSDEVTRRHPLAQLLPALVREAHAARLDLRPLDDAAVRALLQARYAHGADEARLVAYLREQAEGNPFYLGELLRMLEEEGLLRATDAGWALGELAGARVPTLLRQVIEARLARLGDETERLLAIAAVIGQEVPLALWAAVAGVAEEALLAAVGRAAEARVVGESPDGTRARFAHALIRAALYEGLAPSERRIWHRRAGEALAAVANPDPDAVAYHFRAAGDPRAAAWLIRAAQRAQRAFASLIAAERCEAALALLPDNRAHARERGWLGFHVARLRRLDDPRRGLDHLATAARQAAETGDAVLAAYAVAQRGVLRAILGAPRRGLVDLEAGVAALGALPPGAAPVPPPADAQATPAYYRGQLVDWLVGVGRYGEALTVADRMVAAGAGAVAAADLPAPTVYRARGGAHAALGRPDQAGAEFARARAAIGARWPPSAVSVIATGEAVWVALPYQADRPAVRRGLVAEVQEALAREDREMLTDWPQRLNLLPFLLVEGAWAEGRQLADTLLALLAGRRAGLQERLAVGAAAELAHAQGDAERVRWLVGAALPEGPPTPPGDTAFAPALALQRLAARLAREAGDVAAARAWLAAHDRWLAWAGAVLGQAEGQLGWADYHRAAGDAAVARKHAEAALAHAAEPRQPLALLAAHRLLGELDTAAGRHAEARAHLDGALALAEACAAPYERALTLLALAELRDASGRIGDAGTLLAEVRAICTPLEARPALARAEALASPPGAAAPDGLSPREVEVLQLLAGGRSTQQVAEALFLSPRTVKRHIANVYLKIGAHGRAEATAYALRHHLA